MKVTRRERQTPKKIHNSEIKQQGEAKRHLTERIWFRAFCIPPKSSLAAGLRYARDIRIKRICRQRMKTVNF